MKVNRGITHGSSFKEVAPYLPLDTPWDDVKVPLFVFQQILA